MIENFTEYHHNYYYKRRQKIWDYLGGKCVRCGRTEGLEVDHIDRTLKSFNISENMTLNNPAVRAELDKCQLLCSEHHHEKTAVENSGWTHGTYYGFQRRGCKCTSCVEAKRAWNDRRNLARKKRA